MQLGTGVLKCLFPTNAPVPGRAADTDMVVIRAEAVAILQGRCRSPAEGMFPEQVSPKGAGAALCNAPSSLYRRLNPG